MPPRVRRVPDWTRWVAIGAGLLAFASLLLWAGRTGPVGPDEGLLAALAESRSDATTSMMLVVTRLGAFWTLTALTALGAIALSARSRRSALFLVVATLGAGLVNLGTKAWVSRPRPEVVDAVYQAGGWSFPSGHSMVTAAFFLAVVLVVRQWRPRFSALVATVALPLVIAVGLTRVYLGVHYPTDVLAGWALGLSWVGLVYAWYRRGYLSPPAEAPAMR